MMRSAPHLLAVHSSVPAASLEAFIAYGRAHPGALSAVSQSRHSA
jgi:tripartite-type tricarboxylate transporter receptor subunit TctC